MASIKRFWPDITLFLAAIPGLFDLLKLSGSRELMIDVPLSLSSEEGAQSSLRMRGTEICDRPLDVVTFAKVVNGCDRTQNSIC